MATNFRKLFVGGNWKSNNTLSDSKQLVENVINKLEFNDVTLGIFPFYPLIYLPLLDVVVAPVFLHLPFVVGAITNKVQVAAQNCSATCLGAYTGEIAYR